MTKWLEVLRFFVDSGERVDLCLPGIGFVAGTIEALNDDVVTLALEMGSGVEKVHLHYGQVGILRR
jgi:hypothetical protein